MLGRIKRRISNSEKRRRLQEIEHIVPAVTGMPIQEAELFGEELVRFQKDLADRFSGSPTDVIHADGALWTNRGTVIGDMLHVTKKADRIIGTASTPEAQKMGLRMSFAATLYLGIYRLTILANGDRGNESLCETLAFFTKMVTMLSLLAWRKINAEDFADYQCKIMPQYLLLRST